MSVSETSLSTSTKTYIERIIMSDKNLRNKIIRLAHSKPELREHLLPLVTSSFKSQYQISFQLMGFGDIDVGDFTPFAVEDKLKEDKKKALNLINRMIPSGNSPFYFRIETTPDPVPTANLHIIMHDGSPISGTLFNDFWAKAIKALIRAKYLSMAAFQSGISTAMRNKSYVSDG